MTAAEIDLALARMAAEIVEKLGPVEEFAVVGIRRRGLAAAVPPDRAAVKRPVPLGILDITLTATT